MTTKQDKTPIDLINKVQIVTYTVDTDNPLQPKLCYENLEHACMCVASKQYPTNLSMNSNEITSLHIKQIWLAKELEREFLRKEEKEKETEAERTITIVSYDIENMEFNKVIGNFNPSLLLNVLNRMRTKIFFEKFLTKGCGSYTFDIEAKNICDYKFKLIDFKPLEKYAKS